MKLPDFGTPWYHAQVSHGYDQDKLVAEAALRRLCLGAELVGMHWDLFPGSAGLLIADTTRSKEEPRYRRYTKTRPYGTLGITIHKWAVLEAMPASLADAEQAIAEALPDRVPEESLQQLMRLRAQSITDIRLGMRVAHLLIGFASGQVLFIHGDHDYHESWQADLVPPPSIDPERLWMLVNTPGGEISIWTPDDFDPRFDADG